MGPCLCGDTGCPSCGPAQGYYRGDEESDLRERDWDEDYPPEEDEELDCGEDDPEDCSGFCEVHEDFWPEEEEWDLEDFHFVEG